MEDEISSPLYKKYLKDPRIHSLNAKEKTLLTDYYFTLDNPNRCDGYIPPMMTAEELDSCLVDVWSITKVLYELSERYKNGTFIPSEFMDPFWKDMFKKLDTLYNKHEVEILQNSTLISLLYNEMDLFHNSKFSWHDYLDWDWEVTHKY